MTPLQDGFEIPRFDLGAPLGEGSYKRAYVYIPDPDYVIAKSHSTEDYDDAYESERQLLHRIAELDVPCARIYASGIVVDECDGREYPSNLMKRYAASNRSCPGSFLANVLNEKSLASTLKIHSRLEDLSVAINDLQFLVGDDGEVVVNDPLKLLFGTTPDSYRRKDNRYVLYQMAAAARFAIHCRETGARPTLGTSWQYIDTSRGWVEREGGSQKRLMERFPEIKTLEEMARY